MKHKNGGNEFQTNRGSLLRNGLNRAYCRVSAHLKCHFLMFISILVFRPEGQIWNPVRRDTRIYERRILNASRISKTHMGRKSHHSRYLLHVSS